MAKRNVQCVKPTDPPFLRKMKEKCGFAQVTPETKKEALSVDPDALEDRDEELPQVVVLKKGDLTQEEADAIIKAESSDSKEFDLGHNYSTGAILISSSSSKRKDGEDNDHPRPRKKKKLLDDLKHKKDVKAVKNTQLLSFDDHEDEEDDD